MSATMTREDVIQLAREACDKTKVDAFYNGYWTITQDELERVIHLATQKAAAEEMESCALAAEAECLTDGTNDPADVAYNNAVKHCTAAIRARKDNT